MSKPTQAATALSSREKILANIRAGIRQDSQQTATANECTQVQERLASHPRSIQPQRTQLSHAQAVTVFVDMAQQAAAEIIPIQQLEDIPQHIQNLGVVTPQTPLVLANDPMLQELHWQPLATTTRVAQKGDIISLTRCLAGVAETGTLVLKSNATSPTTLNFLTDIHAVVLKQDHIINSYEDAWDLIRQADLPRTVNFITGPSRSADIEQTLQMGAHGPKRLIIFLL